MIEQVIVKIKSILKSSANRRIGENFLALGLLNGIYMLSPLILIPYLMRTIGAEAYGVYIFVWTLIYYFIFIVNYGFDFTATKEIAIHKDDLHEVSRIFSITFITRLLLVIISFILLFIVTFSIPKLNELSKLILLGSGVIIGQALFPTWMFQGMQEMKFITIVNAITRLTPLALIFLFVKSTDQLHYILLFQSVGFLIGGVFSHFFALKHYKLQFELPTKNEIRDCLQSGWSMFLSTVGISFYREANTVILGFTTGNFEIVGFYALADKVLRVFQVFLNSFSQAIFPHFSNKMSQDENHSLNSFNKIGKIYGMILIVITLILILIIPYVLKIYLGGNYVNVVLDSRILLPVVFIGGMNYYYGVVGLVNLNYQNRFTRFVLIAGAVNIISCLILSQYWADVGAAISLVTAESVLLLLILRFSVKSKII